MFAEMYTNNPKHAKHQRIARHPGGYTYSRGYATPGGYANTHFDDPDLDDEHFAYYVIPNVDFPGQV